MTTAENVSRSCGPKAPVQYCRKPTLLIVVYQGVVTVSKGRNGDICSVYRMGFLSGPAKLHGVG